MHEEEAVKESSTTMKLAQYAYCIRDFFCLVQHVLREAKLSCKLDAYNGWTMGGKKPHLALLDKTCLNDRHQIP
jgi:hypothetical protein